MGNRLIAVGGVDRYFAQDETAATLEQAALDVDVDRADVTAFIKRAREVIGEAHGWPRSR